MCDEQQHHSISDHTGWGSGGGLRFDSAPSHHCDWDCCSRGELSSGLLGVMGSTGGGGGEAHVKFEDNMMHVKGHHNKVPHLLSVSGHVHTQEAQVRYLRFIRDSREAALTSK